MRICRNRDVRVVRTGWVEGRSGCSAGSDDGLEAENRDNTRTGRDVSFMPRNRR